MRTFSLIRQSVPSARLLIIGTGPHKPALESLAAELGIAKSVIWAGYHEDDLAEHYRTADAMVFTAPGSDEGHRAVLEAMGCGVPAATYPIPGMSAILGSLTGRLMSPEPTPASLAGLVVPILQSRSHTLSRAVVDATRSFHFDKAAQRLLEIYTGA